MTTPITYPTLPQNANYCLNQDVLNLIGGIAPAVSGSLTSAQIQSAITSATKYIESQTMSFFSPRRIIRRYDGNGSATMTTGYKNLIVVNNLQVLFTFPGTLAANVQDHDLLFDGTQRASGEINFPVFNLQSQIAPLPLPIGNVFFPGLKNVTVDAWYGPHEFQPQEQLATTDHTTYTFANPSVVMQSVESTFAVSFDNPPQYYPLVYKNGQLLTNTTYQRVPVNEQDGSTFSLWQISQDNIYYKINWGANGGASITFNTPNLSTDVITCDYLYWAVPADVAEACAKRAACQLLGSVATASLPQQQFQGASEIQMDGARIQYQGGAFSGTIKQWMSDVADVIKSRKAVQMAFGLGRPRNWGAKIW